MKETVLLLGSISLLVLSGCNKGINDKQKSDVVISEQVSKNNEEGTLENTQKDSTISRIEATLKEMFKDDLSKNLIEGSSREFKFFEYDLNDDNEKEIFVGLTGPYFCGSGGCTLLLLSSEGKLITKFTVTQFPVSIENTKSEGWKDLVLHSNHRDYLIKYNGNSYPSNPSVQPFYSSADEKKLIKGLELEDQSYSW